MVLHCDSQSAIHLVKNQVYRARTKHIAVQYPKIREWVSSGDISLSKILTSSNRQVQALLGLDWCLQLVSL